MYVYVHACLTSRKYNYDYNTWFAVYVFVSTHIKVLQTLKDNFYTKTYKVQGHMYSCLHTMLVCGTIIFLTQKELLNNKNFGANFLMIVLSIVFSFSHNDM